MADRSQQERLGEKIGRSEPDEDGLHDVLIRLRSPATDNRVLEARTKHAQKRVMIGSPNGIADLIRSEFKIGHSVSSRARARSPKIQEMKAQACASLGTLLKAVNQVRRAKRQSSAGRRVRPAKRAVSTFWSSNSARVHLSRDEIIALLQVLPSIEDVHLNRRIRLFQQSSATPNPSTPPVELSGWGIRKIEALPVWAALDCRGEDVTIGMLDTGVDAHHPDLAGKVRLWAEFTESGGKKKRSRPHDSEQHGTHCAGVLVGGNASGRWIGVAPKARLAAAMVLVGSHVTDSQVLAGLEWALEKRVDVISVSLGGHSFGLDAPSTYSRALLTAAKLGIPVVVAVGNDGDETTDSPGNDVLALSVGATDAYDRVAGFSGGRTQIIKSSPVFPASSLPLVYSKPDVTAPGVQIYSSVPGGNWTTFSGTSCATPHVAGAIALLLSATSIRQTVHGLQRVTLIEDLLLSSVVELGLEAGQSHRFGFGRIDVLQAVSLAKSFGW